MVTTNTNTTTTTQIATVTAASPPANNATATATAANRNGNRNHTCETSTSSHLLNTSPCACASHILNLNITLYAELQLHIDLRLNHTFAHLLPTWTRHLRWHMHACCYRHCTGASDNRFACVMRPHRQRDRCKVSDLNLRSPATQEQGISSPQLHGQGDPVSSSWTSHSHFRTKTRAALLDHTDPSPHDFCAV